MLPLEKNKEIIPRISLEIFLPLHVDPQFLKSYHYNYLKSLKVLFLKPGRPGLNTILELRQPLFQIWEKGLPVSFAGQSANENWGGGGSCSRMIKNFKMWPLDVLSSIKPSVKPI